MAQISRRQRASYICVNSRTETRSQSNHGAAVFPVIRDLVVDRSAFDRIIAAGGYISINVGGAPDGNAIPISKSDAQSAFDSAACIGCGECVAGCKNASTVLFVGAKVAQLAILPQGQPERSSRVLAMVAKMDEEGFGACTNTSECEASCPKEGQRKQYRPFEPRVHASHVYRGTVVNRRSGMRHSLRRNQPPIVSWRTLYLSRLERETPDLSCECVFDDSEWKSIYQITQQKPPPTTPLTLDEVVKIAAQL
jgi:ferredoxin